MRYGEWKTWFRRGAFFEHIGDEERIKGWVGFWGPQGIARGKKRSASLGQKGTKGLALPRQTGEYSRDQ